MTAQDHPQGAGRSPALQAVIAALPAAFAPEVAAGERAAPGAPGLDAVGRAALSLALARLAEPGPKGQPRGLALAMATLLPKALAPLQSRSDALAPLAEALLALAPDMAWTVRTRIGPHASPDFATRHANTLLVGPGGLEERGDVWLGLSLMAPGIRYPDHDHPPEEVYLTLSEGDFWHAGEDWLPRQPGQTFYNRPGILHAMRAGAAAPFLALWLLPVQPG